MTNCGLWLNHKWVKTPLTPLTRTPVGWGASGTFLNGGAYALASKTRHYEISAQWMGTQAEIASVIDEIDTGEPIYMTDPFSYANILPHWLANPQAMTKDAPYFTAVRPTLTATPVEDVRNYIRDPLFTSNGAPQWQVQSPATLSAGSITIPAEFTPNAPLISTTGYVIPTTPGETWTASINILSATAGQYRLAVLFRDGSTVTGSVQSATAISGPGTYTVSATAPANTDRVQWYLYAAGTGPNRTLKVAEPMLTETPGPVDFFFGGTPDTETYQYVWADTPNNSASIRYRVDKNLVFTGTGTKTFTVSVPEPGGRFAWYGSGSGVTVNGVPLTVPPRVVVARNLCPNPTAVAGGATLGETGGAAWSRTQGVMIPSTSNGTLTAAEITNVSSPTWIAAGNGVDGLIGNTTPRTVTMLVRNPNAVDIRVSIRTSSQLNVFTTVPAGETRTISRAVDNSVLLYAQRLDGTAQPGDKVQWTDITTTNDFFTGNTPDTETYQYAWVGTPHNSASNRYRVDPATVNVPAGLCTIGMSGSGTRTVNGMVLSVGQEPIKGTPGQGYTQVQCTGVTVTGYSAPSAIDRVGLSATFVEVGGWR